MRSHGRQAGYTHLMSSQLSRRNFLGAGAATVAGVLGGLPSLARGGRMPDSERVKNIIFCVSDGMSASVPTMVDHLSQLNFGRPSYWSWLMGQENVVNGLQDCRSLNSVVTDSAAAASAWGSGRWIWNNQLNTFPDGTELRTLTDVMHGGGVRTGLVTTATMTHATPAGFSVSCTNRALQPLIAELYLASDVDVLLGGGGQFFDPARRSDGKDLYAAFAAKGYAVAKTRDEMVAQRSSKILGIFADSHLPYTVDRDHDPQLQHMVPTLAEMSRAAIGCLHGSPNGFLLQIEGARIDHAAHADDLAGTLYDQIAFEEAVRVAVEFALEDGETLVVVTADHATGNPGLNGFGLDYGDSTPGLLKVNDMRASYEVLLREMGRSPSPDVVADTVAGRLGIQLKKEEAEAIALALDGKSPYGGSIFYGYPQATVGLVLGNHTKVTWTSTQHTSDHVIVTALGPGREQFSGLVQNTSVFDILLGLKGLAWSNPTMTREEAERHRAKRSESGLLEPAMAFE
jgi:alkaline phosphatase